MTDTTVLTWPGTITGTTAHLWLIADATSQPPVEILGLLGPAEYTRADRLVLSARDRYLTQRCMLRMLIGRYLDIPPAAIQFSSVSNGKPCLGGNLTDNLHFNLSDTGSVFSLGFATAGPIGVDMEIRGRSIKTAQLARRICSPTEKTFLETIPSHAFRSTLLRLWVRKEAVLKGLGHGLKTPMRLISVERDYPGEVTFGQGVPDVSPEDHWYVKDIDAGEEFLVSLSLPFLPVSVKVIPTTAQQLLALLTN